MRCVRQLLTIGNPHAQVHTLILQLAIMLEVLSHWLYTNATLAAASKQGYVDHKPLLRMVADEGVDTDPRFGVSGTPWILKTYYYPTVCGAFTAGSEAFLISLYILADPALSTTSTLLLTIVNQVCT